MTGIPAARFPRSYEILDGFCKAKSALGQDAPMPISGSGGESLVLLVAAAFSAPTRVRSNDKGRRKPIVVTKTIVRNGSRFISFRNGLCLD